MERRQFLGVLLAGLGTMPVPKTLLWEPSTQTGDIVLPEAIVSLEQITKRLLRHLSDRLGVDVPCIGLDYDGRADVYDRAARLGDMTPNGPITDQLTVYMGLEGASKISFTGLDDERYIMPMADSLLKVLGRKHGAVVGCGRLALPSEIEQAVRCDDRKTGLSLRGLHHWYLDTSEGDWVQQVRFDILLARA